MFADMTFSLLPVVGVYTDLRDLCRDEDTDLDRRLSALHFPLARGRPLPCRSPFPS